MVVPHFGLVHMRNCSVCTVTYQSKMALKNHECDLWSWNFPRIYLFCWSDFVIKIWGLSSRYKSINLARNHTLLISTKCKLRTQIWMRNSHQYDIVQEGSTFICQVNFCGSVLTGRFFFDRYCIILGSNCSQLVTFLLLGCSKMPIFLFQNHVALSHHW